MSEGDCKLTIGGKARQRHYYLFSDLLIFTKKYRSPFTLGAESGGKGEEEGGGGG